MIEYTKIYSPSDDGVLYVNKESLENITEQFKEVSKSRDDDSHLLINNKGSDYNELNWALYEYFTTEDKSVDDIIDELMASFNDE